MQVIEKNVVPGARIAPFALCLSVSPSQHDAMHGGKDSDPDHLAASNEENPSTVSRWDKRMFPHSERQISGRD